MLFQSGDSSPTFNIMIDVSVLNAGDVVELQLEYDGPPYLASLVDVGGGNTSNDITISLG